MAKQIQDKPALTAAGELEPLLKDWAWFTALGACLVVLGVLAACLAPCVTFATVILFGILLLVGGLVQTITAFWSPKWSGLFLHLVVGVLYLVIGALIIEHTAEAAQDLTLLLAAFFIFTGVIQIIWSLQMQFHQWGWALLNGIITLILGIFIFKEYPESSYLVIGLFIGIAMIFNGWMWLMFGLSLRGMRKEE